MPDEPLHLTIGEALVLIGPNRGLAKAGEEWHLFTVPSGVWVPFATWPEAVSMALGRPVVARDDTDLTTAYMVGVSHGKDDKRNTAELIEALEATYRFLLREFPEPNPETGEVIEAGARELWDLVCDALARVKGEQS